MAILCINYVGFKGGGVVGLLCRAAVTGLGPSAYGRTPMPKIADSGVCVCTLASQTIAKNKNKKPITPMAGFHNLISISRYMA